MNLVHTKKCQAKNKWAEYEKNSASQVIRGVRALPVPFVYMPMVSMAVLVVLGNLLLSC